MKKLILHEVHHRAGAILGEHEGWEAPLHYGDWEREYRALKEGVGVSDLSFRGMLRVRGSDRTSFLHNMLTNDIKALSPGKGCYAALLTDRAKMVSDMFVFAFEDSYLLDIEPGTLEKARQFIEKYIIADDVTIEDETLATGHICFQGPGAEPLHGKNMGSVPLLNGYHMVCSAQSLEKAWADLVNSGAVPVGLEALEALRIEAGIPRFGTDMDDTVLIMEAGLTHAISFTKGCYLGQEIVARVTTHGRLTRKLFRLTLSGKNPLKTGEKIYKNSEEAGYITSSAFSPGLGKVVALGYVKTEYAEPGTSLGVAGREAVVSPLP